MHRLLSPLVMLAATRYHCKCQNLEVQAKGPDIHSTPPDVRHNEDATGDNPDEAEPETDVQHAEHVVQDQLTAQFVTRQR